MFENWGASIPDYGALRRGLRELDGSIVALDRRAVSSVMSVVVDLARGLEVSDARLLNLARSEKSAGTISKVPVEGQKGAYTAIVPITGVALYDTECQPYCFSTKLLTFNLDGLAKDPSIQKIVLLVDTPGGAVSGTREAADAVWNARKRKPVIAVVDPLCASAGFWIASQSTSIIAAPASEVGSVGVVTMHADYSQALAKAGIKPTFIVADDSPYKREANPFEPLSSEAFSFHKGEVNDIMNQFLQAVARGRNTSIENVRSRYGQGRCIAAQNAMAAGMIDRIEFSERAIQQTVTSDEQRKRQARDRRLLIESFI